MWITVNGRTHYVQAEWQLTALIAWLTRQQEAA